VVVQHRAFDSLTVLQLKKDPELRYTQAPAAISLWERFKTWLRLWLNRIFKAAASADWVTVAVVIVSLIALVYVILRLLRVDALRMFYGTPEKQSYEVFTEDIHALDFEKLIHDAIQQQEYRAAIRLLFLQALKLLADRHLIDWRPGKTNHDYVGELSASSLKKGFRELNYYFEYAWYGNFPINTPLFEKVNRLYAEWKAQIK
jgi:hypothetical protein